MNSVDVPFHVVHIIALVITHRTCKEPLPLLAVHLTVVNLNNTDFVSVFNLIKIDKSISFRDALLKKKTVKKGDIVPFLRPPP